VTREHTTEDPLGRAGVLPWVASVGRRVSLPRPIRTQARCRLLGSLVGPARERHDASAAASTSPCVTMTNNQAGSHRARRGEVMSCASRRRGAHPAGYRMVDADVSGFTTSR
jgi:hypothetical protein